MRHLRVVLVDDAASPRTSCSWTWSCPWWTVC